MAYSTRWTSDGGSIRTTSTASSRDYDRSSYDSHRSYSTTHTAHSARPPMQKFDTCLGRVESQTSDWPYASDDGRVSVETYASTEASELEADDNEPTYDIVDFAESQYESDAIPATPRDFAELFPSGRRLSISHDNSSLDGNMNLRVDTLVETSFSTKKENLTLFHLKMNDLRSRDFSLRRYCRNSGREVCKSIRKYHSTSNASRPAITKSLSSVLASVRRQHDGKEPTLRYLRRNDSGYSSVKHGSVGDETLDEELNAKPQRRIPTNTIKLEFSNYAQVEVKRRGAGANKKYRFEYWGHTWTWRRSIQNYGDIEQVSFHLMRDDKQAILSHIMPVPLTTEQANEEKRRGGWIPPCSMWIADSDIIHGAADVADVVVATGLIALVDDTIKRRWHSKTHRQVLLPLVRNSSFRLNMEYIGPKRLIDGVFHRHLPETGMEVRRHR